MLEIYVSGINLGVEEPEKWNSCPPGAGGTGKGRYQITTNRSKNTAVVRSEETYFSYPC